MTGERATEDAIRLTLPLPTSAERADAVFTDGFASWYPGEYTWSRDVLETIGIEGRKGGRCFERGPHGFWIDWGRVLVWEPPTRLVFSWQIGPGREPVPDPGGASEVELRFHEEGPHNTRIEYEHRALSRHGGAAEGYLEALSSEQGWPYMAQCLRSCPWGQGGVRNADRHDAGSWPFGSSAGPRSRSRRLSMSSRKVP